MKNWMWNRRKHFISILGKLIIVLILFNQFFSINTGNNSSKLDINFSDDNEHPSISAAGWAWVNLTNYAINGDKINESYHYHNEKIQINGTLYYTVPPSPPAPNWTPIQDTNVSLLVDSVLYPEFNATTDTNGNFSIDFTIPYSMEIGPSHKLQVNVTDAVVEGTVDIERHLIIFTVGWAKLNLTNGNVVDNSWYYRNDLVPIEGKLYQSLNASKGRSGYEVSVYVDGNLTSSFNDITDSNGEFQINYRVPYEFGVNTSHKIQVNVTSKIKPNRTELLNSYVIFIKAKSSFQITNKENQKNLKIPGESYEVAGYLRYDNGTGIPKAQIIPQWYNDTNNWINASFNTNSRGYFSEFLTIPRNIFSNKIYLRLVYSGFSPYIRSSQKKVGSLILFRGIICVWDVVPNATIGNNITIGGQIFSLTNSSLDIYNRSIRVLYDGRSIKSLSTDSNGNFNFTYTIPAGNGTKAIEIEMVNAVGMAVDTARNISIRSPPPIPPPQEIPPFLLFSLIFIPIIVGVVIALTVYGIRYYKKMDKTSRVVSLPLEGKIKNLKILKETDRVEESLSYLFNAIYMDLVNAKFGRKRMETETIRDFAIVSVKELNLNAASIYPFITRVEEIIYARPFQITEQDFYSACELFSPVYFQLTGYNFVLNF